MAVTSPSASLPSSSGSGSGTPTTADADGYLLLTIQHTIVKQVFDGQSMILARGELRVECITLPIPPEIGHQTANPFAPSPADPPVPTHDFWLVLKVGPSFEVPLIPNHPLVPVEQPTQGIQYSIASPNVKRATLTLTLPKPSSLADLEDLDSFEVLIRQYGCLGAEATALEGVEVMPAQGSAASGSTNAPLPADMRGKLVLVNEDNGEIIGEMDQQIDVDMAVAGADTNQPVILDFGGEIRGFDHVVKIKTVSEADMDDWLLKGAHTVSKRILSFGDWSSRMMASGAEKFIQTSTPRAEPVKFSATTKNNIRRAHNATATSVKVTKATMGKLNQVIGVVVDKSFEKGVNPAMDKVQEFRRDSIPSVSRPPLPPRPGASPPPYSSGASTPTDRKGLSSPTLSDSRFSLSSDSKSPPLVPSRLNSLQEETVVGKQIPIPGKAEVMAQEVNPAIPSSGSSTAGSSTPKKRGIISRIVQAGEVVLTSVDATTNQFIISGTAAASSAAHHKYGAEAGQATALLGGSVRNVAVMYVDVRGVGRRAIVKTTAKGVIKAKTRQGQVVELQGEGEKGDSGLVVEAGEVEIGKEGELVIGMPEVGGALPSEEKRQPPQVPTRPPKQTDSSISGADLVAEPYSLDEKRLAVTQPDRASSIDTESQMGAVARAVQMINMKNQGTSNE